MKNVETSNSPRLLDVAEVAEPLNKQSAREATQQNEHEGTKARDESTQESSALQQQRPIDHSIEQTRTPPRSRTNEAAELEVLATETDSNTNI